MLQEQLMQVYHDHWQSQGDMLTDITRYFRGPDVTTVTSAYENAPIKIALYGKQGLNYDNTLPQFCSGEWTLERILKSYQDFNFGATYFRSPFWENWDLVSTGVFGPTCGRSIMAWGNVLKFVYQKDGGKVLPLPDVPDRAALNAGLELQGDLMRREMEILWL